MRLEEKAVLKQDVLWKYIIHENLFHRNLQVWVIINPLFCIMHLNSYLADCINMALVKN